jgi:hypothetical protein
MVGDLQTAALVSSDGMADWFCAQRFDSPRIFAAPRFLTPDGVGEVVDLMAVHRPETPMNRHRLVRATDPLHPRLPPLLRLRPRHPPPQPARPGGALRRPRDRRA